MMREELLLNHSFLPPKKFKTTFEQFQKFVNRKNANADENKIAFCIFNFAVLFTPAAR